MKTWDELKNQGSGHYKNGSVEPIDLYRAAGAFRDFAICSIIKYAYRNIDGGVAANPVSEQDMTKIIHYAELLRASCSGNISPDGATSTLVENSGCNENRRIPDQKY